MISPPGKVAPPSEAWSSRVSGLIDKAAAMAAKGSNQGNRPAPFYNPMKETLDATQVAVKWSALSGTLRRLGGLSEQERWALADETRVTPSKAVPGDPIFGQDEYCEWSVTRNDDGAITKVTFTSEVDEWYRHLAEHDRPGLIALYKELTGGDVQEEELFVDGKYDGANAWNTRVDGSIVHLAQENNNLWAAIALAAESSVVRTDAGGNLITDAQVLMSCNGLGTADRFSDPSIATTINSAAAGGARLTLADPPGLYLLGIRTEGMRLPLGHGDLTAADLWKPERGEAGRVVRASFAPPEGSFTLGDVLLDGRPIVTGAQLAQRVDVSIFALANEAGAAPVSKACG